jgi:prepilin-type N-terminal cleavage/methylation domain-containing protein
MTQPNSLNQKGFTLIEIMAVLVIMSVLASVAVKKLNTISNTADERAIDVAVSELNSREMLLWTNQKFAPEGFGADGDNRIWAAMDTDLGPGYTWQNPPNQATGGTLIFGSITQQVSRTPASSGAAGRWQET